jgi:hypothetical protein
MTTFSFADVLNFLEANPKRVFNYCHPNVRSKDGCLMAQFFRSKGFNKSDLAVSLNGEKLVGNAGVVVAEIPDMPTSGNFIQEIHDNPEDCRGIASGYQILANIHAFKFPE